MRDDHNDYSRVTKTYEANSPVEAMHQAEAEFPLHVFVRTRPLFTAEEKLAMGWVAGETFGDE